MRLVAIALAFALTACGAQVVPPDPCAPVLEHGQEIYDESDRLADWPVGSAERQRGYVLALDYARHIVNNPECYSNVDVHDSQEALGW